MYSFFWLYPHCFHGCLICVIKFENTSSIKNGINRFSWCIIHKLFGSFSDFCTQKNYDWGTLMEIILSLQYSVVALRAFCRSVSVSLRSKVSSAYRRANIRRSGRSALIFVSRCKLIRESFRLFMLSKSVR